MNKTLNLYRIRKEKGWSQEKVCKELKKYNCSITRSTYSKYETGNRQPSPEMVVKLAQCFGISTDCLFGLTEHTQHAAVRFCANEMCIYCFCQECLLNEIHIDNNGFCGSCAGVIKGDKIPEFAKKFLESVETEL